ncbi:unnamed protein product, partial [Prorocentrum cordatum]
RYVRHRLQRRHTGEPQNTAPSGAIQRRVVAPIDAGPALPRLHYADILVQIQHLEAAEGQTQRTFLLQAEEARHIEAEHPLEEKAQAPDVQLYRGGRARPVGREDPLHQPVARGAVPQRQAPRQPRGHVLDDVGDRARRGVDLLPDAAQLGQRAGGDPDDVRRIRVDGQRRSTEHGH